MSSARYYFRSRYYFRYYFRYWYYFRYSQVLFSLFYFRYFRRRGEHDLARKYLAEAQQIAERGPMPLFLADIQLHRARMFHDKTELAQAAKLISTLAYDRRTEELLDAEVALS